MLWFRKFFALIMGLFSMFPVILADKRSSCQLLCGEFMTDSHPRPFTARLAHGPAIKKIPHPRPFTSPMAHGSQSPAAFTAIHKIPGHTGKAPYGYRDTDDATLKCYPYCWEHKCRELYGGVGCNDNWRGCFCAYFTPLPKYGGTPRYRCVRPGCEGRPKTYTCTVTSCDGLLGGTDTDHDSGIAPCALPWPFCGR